MVTYSHLVPNITLGPPPGFVLDQLLPLERLKEGLSVSDARLRIARRVIRDGELLSDDEQDLMLEGGEWRNPEVGVFALANADEGAWINGGGLAFLETQIDLLSEGGFPSPFASAFYSIYSGADRKSFLSDNALKYGNTVTIHQIESFGKWVEGYPACEIDPARDTDESIILINPFIRPAVATIEFVDQKETIRRRVNAQSGIRLSCAALLEETCLPWTGQIYVSGPNRLVVYFCKHSLADPSEITTLEHSDPYRGEPTSIPIAQHLRRRVGGQLKRILAR